MTTTPKILEKARELGRVAIAAYWAENDGIDPDDPEDCEEWAGWMLDTWRNHWLELLENGASDLDQEACKASYVRGFTGEGEPAV